MNIAIQGPCDTPDCPNDAVVNYGLEEFYCLECHEGPNRVYHERLTREYQEYLDGKDTTDHLIQPNGRPHGPGFQEPEQADVRV